MTTDSAHRAAELAARVSYGRLLAILAARTRDVAGAEDSLAEAFASALRTWPERGIPANPDAWLLAAARNAISNIARHQKVHDAAAIELELRAHMSAAVAPTFPDERLKLLFVCAHPAIDETARTPLMLQTVLGLDAARIANAFLVAPSTMGQRLVRAKTKIRDAGLRFAVPEAEDIPDRMTDVLNAIYAAFGTGWDAVAGAVEKAPGLVDEAIYLARLIVGLMPEEPEAKGLLALMLYCEARRFARRGPGGEFIPLRRQDARLWSRAMIIEAEQLLVTASRAQKFGRFQCEAAIQSVHCQFPVTGVFNAAALRTLYQLLAAHYPSTGVLVAQAAVEIEAGEPAVALQALDAIPSSRTASYQPYWTTRAHALAALGRSDEALSALQTSIGLTEDEQIREYLRGISAGWRSGSSAGTEIR